MGTPSWVIPVASLGAICVVALVFIWWWFPRTWRKGTADEAKIRGEELNTISDRSWNQQVIARALARERGEDVSQMEITAPPPPYAYKGPAY